MAESLLPLLSEDGQVSTVRSMRSPLLESRLSVRAIQAHGALSSAASSCSSRQISPSPCHVSNADVVAESFCSRVISQTPAVLVLTLMSSVNGITYGTLLFHGVFSFDRVPDGVSIWLLATVASQAGVSATSKLPCGMGTPTLEMIPILHAIFANIKTALPEGDESEVLGTCLATMFIATFGLGVLLVLGGRIGCSRWLRVIPLVVLKGALFGISIFLLQSAVTSAAATTSGGEALLTAWPRWTLAVVLGSALFVLEALTHSPTGIALFLFTIAVAPQAFDWFGVASIQTMRDNLWLFPAQLPGTDQVWYEKLAGLYIDVAPSVAWNVVVKQAPAIMGLWLTHTLCTLMDLKAIELLTQTDIDIDAELQAVGAGNILSALSGAGWPVYTLCSQNVTCHKLGGRSKIVALVVMTGTFGALFVAQNVVPYLPRALSGCVAWWLGLTFMKETIVDITRKHTNKTDVAIVVIMAAIIIYSDFLTGLLVGILLAMGSFVLQYSGSNSVLLAVSDARFFRSNVIRSLAQQVALERLGQRIAILHLEGHLMFGSSPQLVDAVHRLLGTEGPDWMILNCRCLRGLDYTAALDFAALGRRAEAIGRCLVLTELRGPVLDSLRRARLQFLSLPSDGTTRCPNGLCYCEHYNETLKYCEDQVLAVLGLQTRIPDANAALTDFEAAMLQEQFGDFLEGEDLSLLRTYFECVEFPPGKTLWRSGDLAQLCVGVVRGHLHAMRPPATKDADPWLIEVVGVGAFVGIAGMLNHMPYEMTVIVPSSDVEPCIALTLSWDSYLKISEEQPKLANALLRSFFRRLSYEWRDLSRMVSPS